MASGRERFYFIQFFIFLFNKSLELKFNIIWSQSQYIKQYKILPWYKTNMAPWSEDFGPGNSLQTST